MNKLERVTIKLECKECGSKTSTILVDKPSKNYTLDAIRQQLNAVTLLNHRSHDFNIEEIKARMVEA